MKSFCSRAISLAFSLSAVTMLSACGYGSEVRVAFHQGVPAGTATTFSLKNTAGTVRIQAWSQPTIDIAGYKTGRTIEAADAITIDVKRVGQAVTVSTDYPDGSTSGGAIYRIRVPAGTPITVDNAAGTVEISGTTSDVTGTVGAGTLDVTMDKLSGTQRLTLKSTTGTVALHVPPSSDATFSTHVNVGSVKTDLPPTLGKGSAQVNLTANVGSITIDRE